MVEVTFLYPRYLFWLLVVPLFVFIHFYTLKSAHAMAARFANFEAIARIRGIDFFSKNLVVLFVSCLIVILSVFSISGMAIKQELEASSYSFVIAIDSSTSMEATDVEPSRFLATKKAALDFVDTSPPETSFGVVSFSGNAYIEQDLTADKRAMREALNSLVLSDLGGTDLYEAIVTSTNLLKGQETKAILVVSDGQLNVGTLGDIVDYASANGVTIHTIAVGSEIGGFTSYGVSKVDEESLKSIAYNTGGKFFHPVDEEGIRDAFNQSLSLTKRMVLRDISHYLAIAALVLFLFLYFLVNTRYRRIP